jgi:hypothetical protein
MQRPRVFAALLVSGVITLVIACTAGMTSTVTSPAGPAAADPTARTIVRDAIDAMGGEARIRAIHSVHMAIMASGALIEGSDRPEAPWQISHYLLDDWLDYQHGAWRKDVQSMVVDGGDGRWQKFSVIAVDGVAAVLFDGKARRGSPVHVGDGAEHLLYQPYRLALAACDAPDVRLERDASIAGQPHQIVAFRHAGRSIRLWIDVRTHRLNAAEIVHTLAEDAYWRVHGDIHDRLDFLRWTLEPSGVWFARQYDMTREGIPYHSFLVTALEVNAVAPETFAITDDARADYRSNARGPGSIPGPGERPIEAIAPGVWFAPAARNALLIGQPGGALLVDAPVSDVYVGRALDELQQRFGAPAAAVILSNADLAALSGIREAAARGVTIRALDANAGFVEGLLRAPHTLAPDALARSGRRATVASVATRTVLGNGATRVELIPMRGTLNERVLLVWLPGPRLLWVASALGSDPKANPSRLAELSSVIAREHLDVDTVIGGQLAPTRWADVRANPDRG